MCSSFPTPARGLFISAHTLEVLAAIHWLQQDSSGEAGVSLCDVLPGGDSDAMRATSRSARGTSWLSWCKLVQFPTSSALPAGFPTVE